MSDEKEQRFHCLHHADPICEWARGAARRQATPAARLDAETACQGIDHLLRAAEELSATANNYLNVALTLEGKNEHLDDLLYLRNLSRDVLARQDRLSIFRATLQALPKSEKQRGRREDTRLKALVYQLAAQWELEFGKLISHWKDRSNHMPYFTDGVDQWMCAQIERTLQARASEFPGVIPPDLTSIQYYLETYPKWRDTHGVNSSD